MFLSSPCVLLRYVFVLTVVLSGLTLCAGQERLNSSTDKAGISGTVTDKSGAVVQGASAILTSALGANLTVPVGPDGAYSVTGLYPGTYTLTVSAPNFADTVFENFTLTPGKQLKLDATMEVESAKPAVEAASGPQNASGSSKKIAGDKAAISGTATDQSGAVVTGAKAVLVGSANEKREVTVDARGAYSFDDLAPGTYTLTVSAPNFAAKVFDNVVLTAGLELALDAPL